MKIRMVSLVTAAALLLHPLLALAAEGGDDLPTLASASENTAQEVKSLIKMDFETYEAYAFDGPRAAGPDYFENSWGTPNGATMCSTVLDPTHGVSWMQTTHVKGASTGSETSRMIDTQEYNGDLTVRYETRSSARGALSYVALRTREGAEISVARWLSNGTFYLPFNGGAVTTPALPLNQWHTVLFQYRRAENLVNIWIDGTLYVDSKVPFGGDLTVGIQGIRMYLSGETDSYSDVVFDNLAIYSGLEDIPFGKLPEMKTVAEDLFEYEKKMYPLTSVKDTVALKVNSPYICVDGERQLLDPGNGAVTPISYAESTYVPLRFIGEYLGGTVYSEPDGAADVLFPSGRHIRAEADGQTIWLDDTRMEMMAPVVQNDRIFVPLRAVAEALNKTVTYFDKNDFILISDGEPELNEEHADYERIVDMVTYTFPTAEQIRSAFDETGKAGVHPRLLLTPEKVQYIRQNYQTDENLVFLWQRVKELADAFRDSPNLPVWNPNENGAGSNTNSIGSMLNSASYCGLAYLITGEEAYKDRVWEAAQAAISFNDWNWIHFLDTSTMTVAIAYAYDWLYDYWTPEQREYLRQGAIRLGFRQMEKQFEGKRETESWINTVGKNWAGVCNGGMGAAALVFFETDPEYFSHILEWNLESLPGLMNCFAPMGDFEEGIGYWCYAWQFAAPFLQCLERMCGSDFGYLEIPKGAMDTAYYPIYMSGPGGMFNFHDSDSGYPQTYAFLYFAEKLGDPSLAEYRLSNLKSGKNLADAFDMALYNPNIENTAENGLTLDHVYDNPRVATGVTTSSWTDPNALYAALHGGPGNAGHGQLDIGTFILDANGERFFLDLGREDYSLQDDYGQIYLNSHNFYRKRAEGHNTVVINPPGDKGGTSTRPIWYDQDLEGEGLIVDSMSKERGSYVKLDMTSSNADEITSGMRGMMMVDGRKQIVLQDEFTLKAPSDVWWFAHTKANVTLAEDGRSAVLELNGKYLNVTLRTDDEDLKLGIMAAQPLPGSPQAAQQSKNEDTRKLFIHGEQKERFYVSVVFTPIVTPTEPVTLPEYTPLADWNIPDGELDNSFGAELTSISVDGKAFEDFSAEQSNYVVETDAAQNLPQVTAEYKGNAEMKIYQAESVPGSAVIVLTDKENGNKKSYTLRFVLKTLPGLPEGATECTPIKVSASAEPQPENPKENSIDGDVNTRWSASGRGGQWIEYDLGEVYDLNGVSIAWHSGSTRSFTYKLEISPNGRDYTVIYNGESLICEDPYNSLLFPPTKARFVRITGYGNTTNEWNSICETKIFRKGE